MNKPILTFDKLKLCVEQLTVEVDSLTKTTIMCELKPYYNRFDGRWNGQTPCIVATIGYKYCGFLKEVIAIPFILKPLDNDYYIYSKNSPCAIARLWECKEFDWGSKVRDIGIERYYLKKTIDKYIKIIEDSYTL